jgi:hypothetical protein
VEKERDNALVRGWERRVASCDVLENLNEEVKEADGKEARKVGMKARKSELEV